jgi:hypothetical protein
MVYDYVKVTQIHSINRFPQRWCYPVSLLMQEKEGAQFSPQYCNLFHSDASHCCYHEIIRGKEYSTEIPIKIVSQSNLENEENVGNNMDLSKSIISKNTSYMMDTSFNSDANVDKVMESLNINSVWQNDEVSPASYLLSHKKSNPSLHWDPQATTRIFPVRDANQINLEVLIH